MEARDLSFPGMTPRDSRPALAPPDPGAGVRRSLDVKLLATLAAGLSLAAAPSGGWHTLRTGGTTWRYPPSWSATVAPLTLVTSPRQLVAIASYPLPRGPGRSDGCRPTQALDLLPPGGAFVFVWSYGQLLPGDPEAHDFPPRPRRFRLTNFARYECMGPSFMLTFRDSGRAFQVHVALGRHASAATRATVLRILDSFRVQP
jgi:hypothetical protein